MYLISNRQRQEAIDFLTAFIALTDDKGSNKVYNLKRRAGLLVKRLNKCTKVEKQ